MRELKPNETTTDGQPFDPNTKDNGQQKNYIVLTEEERAKGFVRPVRRSYRHVGRPKPKYAMRQLSDVEKERHADCGYVFYEMYPKSELPACGRYWTQAELDSIDKGCGTVTTMGLALAETYSRDPKFYGATFCAHCGKHLPVGAEGEFVWDGTDERVGT